MGNGMPFFEFQRRNRGNEVNERQRGNMWGNCQNCMGHSKITEPDVIRSWAATKCLIMTIQRRVPCKMHSEVMAPLLLKSPTDFSTLYTALKLTQDMSVFVVSSHGKTVNTLDMDLYKRAMKIKSSINDNLLLRPGGLCLSAHIRQKHKGEWS